MPYTDERGRRMIYKLTAAENALLRALGNVEGQYETEVAWAAAAGVSQGTVSRALSRPGFVEHLQRWHLARLHGKAKAIVDRSVEEALADSFQDRRMLLEMIGIYKPRQRTEVTGADGGPVRLSLADIIRQIKNPDESVIEAEVSEVIEDWEEEVMALPAGDEGEDKEEE